MTRFTSGLLGGVAMGLLLGAGITMSTDDKQRRRMMRDSKRAMRKAGNYFEDMFS